MARSKSSGRWLREHFDDIYVRKAQKEGYRSRAVYKLVELDQKDHILKQGMTVVDLGAAPGGWSQYAAEKVGDQGRVVALDLLKIDSIAGVEFIQGDFRVQPVLDQLLQTLGESQAGLVLSDMAPNISGVNAVDQPQAMYLCELALELAEKVLKPGGSLAVKVFQGEGFDDYIRMMRKQFKKVVFRKPKASRARSREVYALATGFKL